MNQVPAPAGYAGLRPYGQSGTGRTLLVNSHYQQMLDQFRQLSQVQSSEGYHAQAITRAVDGLRGCVAPANSFMKNGNPNRRCIVFSGFEVEYELNSYYGGPQTDVVIVDIRFTQQQAQNTTRAALWHANFNKSAGVWQTSRAPRSTLRKTPEVSGSEKDPIKIGINGYCDDINHAIRILPDHICRGNQNYKEILERTGYQIFYVPQSGSALKSGWQFIRDYGRNSEDELRAARILAGHMKEAHDQGLYVDWTSHRGGSKVLTQAMKLLERRNVNLESRQSVFLSDHTSSHFSADVARRAIGMNTGTREWHNSTKGIAQLSGGQNFGTASLACSLNELVHHTERENIGGKIATTGATLSGIGYGAYQSAPNLAKLVADFGINPAVGSTLLTLLGKISIIGVTGVAAASIPSLNEGYNTGVKTPLKNLGNKIGNSLFPPKK